MAKLYFRYGAMGSSKTANAIMVWYNYHERGQRALLLKPATDTRDGVSAIRSRCGDGYAADDYTGKNRVNAMVYADTAAARRDNLENDLTAADLEDL